MSELNWWEDYDAYRDPLQGHEVTLRGMSIFGMLSDAVKCGTPVGALLAEYGVGAMVVAATRGAPLPTSMEIARAWKCDPSTIASLFHEVGADYYKPEDAPFMAAWHAVLRTLGRSAWNEPVDLKHISGPLVYVVKPEGISWVKIGHTSGDILNRVSQLQTGCPTKLRVVGWCRGSTEIEADMHNHCAERRGQGEWFKEEVVDWLSDWTLVRPVLA